jgi:hypothetical protein
LEKKHPYLQRLSDVLLLKSMLVQHLVYFCDLCRILSLLLRPAMLLIQDCQALSNSQPSENPAEEISFCSVTT